MKVLAIVAALVVAARASPLANQDVTDFDKVSAMITDAQNDNFEKAGYEAEMLPAWETPQWMGRRSNNSLVVSAQLRLTADFPQTTRDQANTKGQQGYAYFACIYLSSVNLACPSGNAAPETLSGISSYSQILAFVTVGGRRASSTAVQSAFVTVGGRRASS